MSEVRDAAAEKISLIFEFNNDSPLFARAAQIELGKGNFEKAIKILEQGIEKYPDYPTGQIIYAIATAHIGKLSKAKQILSQAYDLLDSDESFEHYVKVIEEIVFKKKRFTEVRGASFVSEDIESERDSADENNVEEKSESGRASMDDLDDNLEALAEQLSNAKIDASAHSGETLIDDFESPNEEIVSETMAGIYTSQGNYHEAMALYEKMIEDNPEKADHYRGKIEEIKELLRN